MPLRVILALTLSVLSGAGVAMGAGLVYKVGLPEAGYPPYSFAKDDPRPGIFVEILAQALSASEDLYQVIYAPTIRLKQLFEKGQIDVECGISPEWRSDQADISVYSRPFTTIVDVALRRIGDLPVNRARADAPLRVGAVRGYRYPRFEDNFTTGLMRREDGDNEQQLMVLLHRKRVDLVLVGKMPALHHMKVNPEYRFEVDRAIDSVPVSFRVNKAKKELLPRLNRALNAMLKDGTIERIIADHQ